MVCGTFPVPEDHDEIDSKKIHIAYAIFKAKSGKPVSDPMIIFSGGPGSSSLHEGFLEFMIDIPFRKERDVIVFDQRGINYSSGLPDIGLDIFNVMAANLDINEERDMIRRTLNKYAEKARMSGIELGNYISFQSARDIGVLMESLGYEKYNLFGISYGTRLARLVQDMFPGKVNTAILDSPNPMTDDFLIDRMRSYAEAAKKIFGFCEEDKEYGLNYPGLRRNYVSTIKSLKKNPLSIEVDGEVFYLNSQDAMFFLRHRLYRNDAKESFPAFVDAIKNSEKETIRQAIINEKFDAIDGRFNTSMFLAVSGYESMDESNTAESIDKLYSSLPNFPEQLGFYTNLYIEEKTWHKKRLPLGKREFQISKVPTITFVNHYDPVTPPENGNPLKRRLTNAWLYVLDEAGHSGGDMDCKESVMIELMNNPRSEPDSSCLNIYKAGSN